MASALPLHILLPLLLYFLFRKKRNIDAITYNDGSFYKGIDPEYYFEIRLNEDGLHKDIKEKDIELNTSRPLKDDKTDNVKINEKVENNMLVLNNNPTVTHLDTNVKDNNYINKTMDVGDLEKVTDTERGDSKKRNMYADLTNYKNATYMDYINLLPEEADYDKRTFVKYFLDELTHKHNIIKLFLKRSLLEPAPLIVLKLLLNISLTIGINAITISDSAVEERAQYANRVKITNFRIA
jgi:hypothetical protein